MPVQPDNYTNSKVVSDMQAAAAASGDDYKCIITMFFYGGIDMHNVVIPSSGNSNLPIYENMRADGVRIPANESTEIGYNPNLSTPVDDNWAVNNNFSVMSDMWADGDVAIIHDTGTLIYPTSKTLYTTDTTKYQPVGLFAHNEQQALWQAADVHKGLKSTGWYGRISNLMDPYFNTSQTIDSSSFTLQGTDKQSITYEPVQRVTLDPITKENLDDYSIVDPSDLAQAESEMIYKEPEATVTTSNLVISSFAEIFNTYSSSQDITSDNYKDWNDSTLDQVVKDRLNQIFNSRIDSESSYYIGLMKKAARIIYSSSSDAFNQRRQQIFMSMGGWDHHAKLREEQDPQLRGVSSAIEALVTFLKDPAIDMYNSVVICHESDFSRTLSSNNTAGTDHAWASHSFVIGGPVNGGFYPTNYQPDYDLDGGKSDGSTLGRYIPEVSIDAYYSVILEWFGVPRQHLHLVLPALPNFTTTGNAEYKFASKPINVTYSIDFI